MVGGLRLTLLRMAVHPNPLHRHPRPNGDAAGHTAIEQCRPLALLVDVQNISPLLLPQILAIASRFGEVVLRRAFGVAAPGPWYTALV